MVNNSLKKTPVAEQDPIMRSRNFSEVTLGYSKETAVEEAKRCLNCKHKPCMQGCPVNVKIPDFISQIASGDFEAAYLTVRQTNSLPAICGRVCPQETQCEQYCVRAAKGESVAIGRLERFAADWHMNNAEEHIELLPHNTRRVAIVGSGPAGLTCAGDLAKTGYDVTIFEALHASGGVLVYGIPEFRLPKEIVQNEIEGLKRIGVKIQNNMIIGKIFTLEQLFEDGFEAIFLGMGAGLPSFLGIPGENYNGVCTANEFLTRINLMKAYKGDYCTPVMRGDRIAVIGGGNVAMDAARSAKRLGARESIIVYRRSEQELPARLEELHHAKEEGIIFRLLTNPLEVLGNEDGWFKGLLCQKMELGEPDSSGRRRPVPVEGSDFILDADGLIIAIGQTPNPLIKMTMPGLKVNEHGCVVTLEDMVTTTMPGVFAGGDIVTGAATVILAMGAGKIAAREIGQYLESK